MSPEDARIALDVGASALIVSNHGGRQLDAVVARIDALPAIAEAVDGRAEVLVDGGVRRDRRSQGALARSGARAVLLGRPVLWGLAIAGEAGVARVLELLRAEPQIGLALSGWGDVAPRYRSTWSFETRPRCSAATPSR